MASVILVPPWDSAARRLSALSSCSALLAARTAISTLVILLLIILSLTSVRRLRAAEALSSHRGGAQVSYYVSRQSEEKAEQKSGHRSRRRLVMARSARLAKPEAMPTRFEGGDRGQVHWTLRTVAVGCRCCGPQRTGTRQS
jgi:hypothetical protein